MKISRRDFIKGTLLIPVLRRKPQAEVLPDRIIMFGDTHLGGNHNYKQLLHEMTAAFSRAGW